MQVLRPKQNDKIIQFRNFHVAGQTGKSLSVHTDNFGFLFLLKWDETKNTRTVPELLSILCRKRAAILGGRNRFLCTVLTSLFSGVSPSPLFFFSVSFLIWLLRDSQVMEKKLKGKIQGKCKWKEVIITVIMKCLSFKYKNVTLKWTCDPEMHF